MLAERRGSRKTNLYDSLSDGSAQEHLSDYISDSESDWIESMAEVSHIRNPVAVKLTLYDTYLEYHGRTRRTVDLKE